MGKIVKIACRGTDTISIDSLEPFQGNLKDLSEVNYEKLKKEIIELGFSEPISVWKFEGKNYVLGGHQRLRTLKAMRDEGYEVPPVPVSYIEAEDVKEAKKKILALTSQYGEITRDGLYQFAIEAEITAKQIEESFRFPEINLKSWTKEFFEDNTVPPGPEGNGSSGLASVSRVKPGDLILLGNHRLVCGDSTNMNDFEYLMQGETAEFCFTSPPYSDQRDYAGNLLLDPKHLASFLRAAFSRVNYFAVNLGIARRDGEVLTYWDDYISEARNLGLKLLSWNVWDKKECGNIGNHTAMFGISHEWIFVFGREKKDLNRTVPNKWAGEYQDHNHKRQKDGSLTKSKTRTVHEHSQLKTVISQSPKKNSATGLEHPAMFPVELPQAYIEACTNEGDLIYEPFAGSGTTLIAAEMLGRRACLMEIDPFYCDSIISRYEAFTGKQAQLMSKN
jgi:DNA modification methylase